MTDHKPIGKTARGLAVYPVTHPSYSHLERTHAVGADATHLAQLARAAHPHFRAVDHEEASAMHYARRNMQAARAHEAASHAMSKALGDIPDQFLPAPDSSLAWVYEGAGPDMTPEDAATAIRAATLGWSLDDHMQAGALQHHLAVALSDDPRRQATCAAAAYMHVAAAGMDPGKLFAKGLDPKLLRPPPGTKPERIGTTRSGKPIYNHFLHPAHQSFTTPDHVDHINAMEAHRKASKMNKSGKGEGSRGGKVIGHTKGSNRPIYSHEHLVYSGMSLAHENSKGPMSKQTYSNAATLLNRDHFAGFSTADHHSAASLHEKAAKEAPSKRAALAHGHLAEAHTYAAANTSSREHVRKSFVFKHASETDELAVKPAIQRAITDMQKSEAIGILEQFLTKSEKGEGSRGGKVVGHTASGKPIYAANSATYRGMKKPPQQWGSEKDGQEQYDERDRTHIANVAHVKKKYPKFTAADHESAAKFHENSNNHHAAGAHHAAAGYFDQPRFDHLRVKKSFDGLHASNSVLKLSKAGGEGSRGGKVIGHTKSGKPIYAATSKRYSWNGADHVGDKEKAAFAIRHHGDFSAKDHADAAEAHAKEADKIDNLPVSSSPAGMANMGRYIRHRSLAMAHHAAAAAMGGVSSMGQTAIKVKGSGISRPSKNLKHSMTKSDVADALQTLATLLQDNTDSTADVLGGNHNVFMQQAELANNPTMWAPICAVPEN